MRAQFTTGVATVHGVFRRGAIIETTDLPPRRAAVWIERGILQPIAADAEPEGVLAAVVSTVKRKAVTGRGKRKAVTSE